VNRSVTSRGDILRESRLLVMREGLGAVSMRSVARACGIAVGSVYNYFPSKEELLREVTGEVWEDVFHVPGDAPDIGGFAEGMRWFAGRLAAGRERYPGFFSVHAMSLAAAGREAGRAKMEAYVGRIRQCLLAILRRDGRVRADAFARGLSAEGLVGLVFDTLLSRAMRGQEDPEPLISLVSQAIY